MPAGVLAPPTAGAGRESRLAARAEALATRRNGIRLLALASVVALGAFLARPTYPNYDSYYSLVWGRELAHGRLPDYDVFRTPTPHPLWELVSALLSFFGPAADRLLVLLTIASFLGLLVVLFRFTQHLLGTLVAAIGTAFVLTRIDLLFYALRGMVDVPFLLLVFGAALLELRRPRRGLPVLALLALAGLLRPEAWLLSGLYLLWLRPVLTPAQLLRYGALVAAPPLLWVASDWAVTGHPLHSLTSTREVAGQFGRNRTAREAIGLIPDYLGANEKIVNDVAGGLGVLLAAYLLRRRAALPIALTAVGLAVFVMIAIAGLSVIPRYLVIPSLLLNLGVGVALAGWTAMDPGRARKAAVAVAALSLLVVGWRAPSLVNDLRKLNGQTLFVKRQHRQLKAILQEPSVARLLASCRPITLPTHSAIPVVEWETGLSKHDLEASINQALPPSRGVLLVGNTFNFEPAAARSTTGVSQSSARKWWSNYPLSTFGFTAGNSMWRVYARCPGQGG
ncbi:MAG: hypothetical protein IRZ21_05010 [Thermoleophilaceae bacterium]|nr:hypothetical protein [Thermoleophilaceae bacterium]